MACRGIFFAITVEEVQAVLGATDDEQLMVVIERIEENCDENRLAECDKAWDAMHRALTDGRLEYGNGPYPLNQVVLGSRPLHRGDDFIVCYVAPEQVREVAKALQSVTAEWFEKQYWNVVPKEYAPDYGGQDLAYTWQWLQKVRGLYVNASKQGRAVIFTVDQ